VWKSTYVNDDLCSQCKTIFIHITKDIYQTLSVFDLGLVIVHFGCNHFFGLGLHFKWIVANIETPLKDLDTLVASVSRIVQSD